MSAEGGGAVRSFRLLTANLLNGRADPEALSEILDRVGPDVVVTQELGPNAAEVIAPRYPHHCLLPALDHHGRGIASRFPGEFGTIPVPWRRAGWAELDVDGSRVTVANVHLLNPVSYPPWASIRGRTAQIDALLAWEASLDRGPVIVAGDLNATAAWPAYRRMTARWGDLVAGRSEKTGEGPEATWAWRPGWPRLLRIDHVLGSEGIVCTGVSVEPVRGSDHAAVVVDLELMA